ncbi:GNAT family N-acetyltransferase [Qaidamihabitans albus]|uniref:GNAT family N-acetyltransferase n=1 Tax=Qaidamihabitans albus TaxID=2795733 RepID=UPI0018F1EC6E|nr:GNAT family N-acetyltransferase [Qaidamihabitans albus]
MRTPREELTGDGIVLRRWSSADATELRRVVSDTIETLKPWMPWAANGYGPREAAGFLALTERNWAQGVSFDYAIVAGDRIIGSCGLMNRIGGAGLEIGYWLHHDWRGRGLATETAALLVDEAFRVGAEHVEIVHDEHNERSGAVPRRLGFARLHRRAAQAAGGSASNGYVVVWRLERASREIGD